MNVIFRKVKAFHTISKLVLKRDILRNKFLLDHKKWLKDNTKKDLLLEDLNIKTFDIVFDVGGYLGEYSERLYRKYNCYIYVFEPISEYSNFIQSRFENNERIKTFNFGFSDNQEYVFIYKNNNKTSLWKQTGIKEKIEVRKISQFINEKKISKIKLIKLNVEGSEYKIIDDLFKNNLLEKIEIVLVQFHDFIPGYKEKKAKSYEQLNVNHKIDYSYEFVWERWTRRF